MTIGQRIRHLRKEIKKLTQDEFAQAIKISRSNLGNIETGVINATDRVLADICSTFNINEEWLRTGEGEMLAETNESVLAELAAEYNLEGERLNMIRGFLMLTLEQQEAIVKAAILVAEANKKAAAEAAQKEATAAAEEKAEPPAAIVSDVDAPEDLPEDPEIEAEVAKIRAKMYARKKARMSLTSPSTEPFDENKKDPPR